MMNFEMKFTHFIFGTKCFTIKTTPLPLFSTTKQYKIFFFPKILNVQKKKRKSKNHIRMNFKIDILIYFILFLDNTREREVALKA